VCRPCLPSNTEYELVKGLYDIIREERDLESAKINLARRSDFNFYDAFKIFDPTSKGYVTIADLREGLAAIGVFPTSSDMELFIKRYDKYNERKVRFSDFCEAFTPQTDSYYASALNRRRSNYWAKPCGARDDCFEAGTRVEFRSVWNTHFKVEAMCEGIRQRLRSIPSFDLYNAFLTCDLYSDGVITKDELRRFIDCRGFCVTDTDAQQLVDKMDRDKDGRVTYSEVRSINTNLIFSSAMSLSLRASAIIELDKHDLKLLRCGSELTTHMPECVSAIN
jgi:Ca2+-binding EF-hand superfamily protein